MRLRTINFQLIAFSHRDQYNLINLRFNNSKEVRKLKVRK